MLMSNSRIFKNFPCKIVIQLQQHLYLKPPNWSLLVPRCVRLLEITMGNKSVETLGRKILFSSVLETFSPTPQNNVDFSFFRLHRPQCLNNIEQEGQSIKELITKSTIFLITPLLLLPIVVCLCVGAIMKCLLIFCVCHFVFLSLPLKIQCTHQFG